ncbi:hypothetical protein JCM11491_007103 [Sporobolomyces phaffii]
MAQHLQGQNPGSSTQAWEGDATLHSYCYDYMRKRGWNEAASRFAKDAGIKEDDWKGPPIEAPQGLLYEWWSVFWDVFIARSQKSGPRNPNADAYVEAMRAKRDPLVVQFNGPNAPGPMTLPRSLAHPPRPNSTNPPPHARTNYSQMHVLEQQELQNQMQQRGRVQQMVQGGPRPAGMPQQPPTPGGSGPSYAPSPVPQQQQQQQQQQPPPSSQSHPSGMPQAGMQSYPPGSSQPQLAQQRPPSAHSSPHVVPASHAYANGRPQQMANGQPGQMGNALVQALAAVGLPGRDPETLSQEEHAAVTAQMRRMGALPPSSQQVIGRGGPPPQQAQQGRMIPPQPVRQDSQNRLNAAYAAQDGRAQLPPGSQAPQNQLGQPQYMMHPVQQQQQNHMMAQQQRMMQVQQQGGQRQMMDPNGQGGSPASPAYSSAPSPYATPLVAHMQIPSNHPNAQGSPGSFAGQIPPPSRTGTSNKNRVVSQPAQQPQQNVAKGSPMQPNLSQNAKRQGATGEESSPRNRKRARGSTKDEELMGMGDGNAFEMVGGAGSPGGGNPGGPQGGVGAQLFGPEGVPYRPSPSPLGRPVQPSQPPQQQQHQQGMYPSGPNSGGSGDSNFNSLQILPNGGGAGPTHGNGSHSRPTSAASNHHFLGAPQQPDQRHSPLPASTPTNGQAPSPMTFGGGPTPNGSRPFAGAPNPSSATNTPLPPAPQALAPDPNQSDSNGLNGISVSGSGGNSLQFNTTNVAGGTEDMFAGLDFDSFLNNDMFNEELGVN